MNKSFVLFFEMKIEEYHAARSDCAGYWKKKIFRYYVLYSPWNNFMYSFHPSFRSYATDFTSFSFPWYRSVHFFFLLSKFIFHFQKKKRNTFFFSSKPLLAPVYRSILRIISLLAYSHIHGRYRRVFSTYKNALNIYRHTYYIDFHSFFFFFFKNTQIVEHYDTRSS